jgi:hypothetical protein
VSERCEYCGCDKIYSGPPDCPRCGAPVCCEVCCREETMKQCIEALEAQLKASQESDELQVGISLAAQKLADKAEAQLKAVRELLSVATCPDPNCDKKGTVCLGEYQHESGEVEQHLEQCRWCAERDKAQEAGE